MNCWYLWDARCTISLTRWRWSRGRSGGCLWSMLRSSPPALHSRLRYLWPHHSRTSLPFLPRSRARNRLDGSHIAGNAKIIESPWTLNNQYSHEEPWDKKWVRFWGRQCTELMPCSGVALYSAWSCLPSQCPVPSYHFKHEISSMSTVFYDIDHSTFHVFSTFSRIIFSLWPRAAMSDLGQNWPWAINNNK